MKSSVDILDAVSKKLGGVSDYRITQITRISSDLMSMVRKKGKPLPPSDCKRAAAVLKVDPAILIAIVVAEREDDQELKKSLYRLVQPQ
ncbi:MAG: hypothetical protein HYX63_12245 [Gammaproteobacteria bacterium]|nr:hypothetical protein [Gammaproteobacteria bacterium]